tara:strand:- start:1376 stop:1783 length:408 start_codon:yes stop_codon:yes gene_type:complete
MLRASSLSVLVVSTALSLLQLHGSSISWSSARPRVLRLDGLIASLSLRVLQRASSLSVLIASTALSVLQLLGSTVCWSSARPRLLRLGVPRLGDASTIVAYLRGAVGVRVASRLDAHMSLPRLDAYYPGCRRQLH